ncbi:hypothetical protein JCM5296_006820 [Sporobolomyces johnsonii]
MSAPNSPKTADSPSFGEHQRPASRTSSFSSLQSVRRKPVPTEGDHREQLGSMAVRGGRAEMGETSAEVLDDERSARPNLLPTSFPSQQPYSTPSPGIMSASAYPPPLSRTASTSSRPHDRSSSSPSRALDARGFPPTSSAAFASGLNARRSVHSARSSIAPDSVFGTAPVGVIGKTKPREVIRIERDFSGGETCQFWSGWIWELEGRVSPTDFQNTLNELNTVLASAHDPSKSCFDNCLSILTLYMSPYVIGSNVNKVHNRVRCGTGESVEEAGPAALALDGRRSDGRTWLAPAPPTLPASSSASSQRRSVADRMDDAAALAFSAPDHAHAAALGASVSNTDSLAVPLPVPSTSSASPASDYIVHGDSPILDNSDASGSRLVEDNGGMNGAGAGEDGAGGPGAAEGSRGSKRVNGKVKLDKEGNPQKKRKQGNSACDSCRLRRVKCDKAEQNGGPCSECVKKKIMCTDTYVKNKPKTVRSGKLIAQAKLLFGENAARPSGPGPGGTAADLAVPSPAETVRPPSTLRQDVVLAPAQSRLVNSQVSREIGDHLIRTFFAVFQPQCPLVDQELFEGAWTLAGRVSENLSPANECLAAVIQAWAARISDHPLIVGQAPTLEDLRNGQGRDFTLMGNRREEFARAMRERALRLVDQKGALRLSSAACCSALSLLEFLVTWDDATRTTTCGRYLMVGAAEHLRALNEGQCDDASEQLVSPERASNGTLLWMVYTRDALAAMLGGRPSCLTEDDLTSLCDLFTNPLTADVMSYVSSDDARMLSGLAVASMFRFVVTIVRNTITRLTGPLARRQPLEESTVRELWAEIDTSSRCAAIFRQSVEKVTFGPDPPKTHVWFRDLTSIKSQHTLGIHLNIIKRLDEEEAVAKEGSKDGGAYLEVLKRLKDRSDERFLDAAREYTKLLRGYGSELTFTAFLTTEYSSYYLDHMVDMPAWEQGGSENWPWATKVEEVSSLIGVLKLAGWAWSSYDRNIERARQSLARQSVRLQQHREAAHAALQQSYPPPPFPPAPSVYSTDTSQPFMPTPHSWPRPSYPTAPLPSSNPFFAQPAPHSATYQTFPPGSLPPHAAPDGLAAFAPLPSVMSPSMLHHIQQQPPPPQPPAQFFYPDGAVSQDGSIPSYSSSGRYGESLAFRNGT